MTQKISAYQQALQRIDMNLKQLDREICKIQELEFNSQIGNTNRDLQQLRSASPENQLVIQNTLRSNPKGVLVREV